MGEYPRAVPERKNDPIGWPAAVALIGIFWAIVALAAVIVWATK